MQIRTKHAAVLLHTAFKCMRWLQWHILLQQAAMSVFLVLCRKMVISRLLCSTTAN